MGVAISEQDSVLNNRHDPGSHASIHQLPTLSAGSPDCSVLGTLQSERLTNEAPSTAHNG